MILLLITRETDYALRILRVLADGERHTMKPLCQAEEIPQQFAYKIIKKLAKAKIVQSTRGVDGGCRLMVDLEDVSLYDLLEIMEEDCKISACMQAGYECSWDAKRATRCTVHCQLAAIQRKLDQELKKYSLSSILFEVS